MIAPCNREVIMKKLLVICLVLCTFFTFACTKNNGNEEGENPTRSGETSDSDAARSEDVTALVPTPAPEPTPTPFPTDDVKDYSAYVVTFPEEVNLRNAPDAESYSHKQMEKGTSLLITGKYGDDWYYTEYDGVKGFVKTASVAIAHGYVNANDVRLRAKASRASDEKALLAEHTEIYVIARNEDWYKVCAIKDDKSMRGYVFAEYVAYYDAYVTADDVRLRAEPTTESETKTRIAQGSKVSIISEYNDWYKVSAGEFTGYMSKSYVEYSPTVTKLDKTRGYLIESGVNFREGPSTDCKAITRLAKYAPVYITGETDEWYRVLYNEQEGYVSKDFVEKGRLVVYVIGQDVNLRAGASTDSDLLTKVRQNSEFEIIGADGQWLKGIVNHNTGYIRSDYLSSTTVNGGKKTNEFTDDEIYLAAKVVYLEARDHGTEAYRAVANVIYNRVKSHKFPDNVKSVCLQAGQFSVTWHKNFSTVKPSSQAYNATKDVLNGGIRPMPFNVLFFHASYLGKNWGSDKTFYKTVGDNSFFRYRG